MAGDVVRIKTGISISYINNSTREDIVEIPRAEWDAMSPEARESTLNEIANVMIENSVDAWAYVEED